MSLTRLGGNVDLRTKPDATVLEAYLFLRCLREVRGHDPITLTATDLVFRQVIARLLKPLILAYEEGHQAAQRQSIRIIVGPAHHNSLAELRIPRYATHAFSGTYPVTFLFDHTAWASGARALRILEELVGDHADGEIAEEHAVRYFNAVQRLMPRGLFDTRSDIIPSGR